MIIDAQKYNLLRLALVDNAEEEHDLIQVKPKTFALKKEHDERVLAAAMEILEDRRIIDGITPLDTIKSFEDATPEVALYVLMCYAVAIQQEWIVYSTILNKFYVNLKHKDARQYVEDTHKQLLQ